MRKYFLWLSVCLYSACVSNETAPQSPETTPQEILRPDFGSLLDSQQLIGAILIYDPQQQITYTNDPAYCRIGRLPASTFKIANSIVSLETAVMASDSSISRWDGQSRALPIWEEDLTLHQAFQRSCVPCYQDIARQIGPERMRTQLDKIQYPGMVFDSTTINNFWLVGTSRISPFEQIDFLQRLYNAQLPIQERTWKMLKRMMLLDKNKRYTLSGKTGWAVRGDENNGWFVGYLEKANQVYFFATNISPAEGLDMGRFPALRKAVTIQALEHLLFKAILRRRSSIQFNKSLTTSSRLVSLSNSWRACGYNLHTTSWMPTLRYASFTCRTPSPISPTGSRSPAMSKMGS